MRNNKVEFELEGTKYVVFSNPHLLGEHDLAGLIAHSPQYASPRHTPRLDQASLDYLIGWREKTELVIYFGTWCPLCKQLMPAFVQVAQKLANRGSGITFKFRGLPGPTTPSGGEQVKADLVDHCAHGPDLRRRQRGQPRLSARSGPIRPHALAVGLKEYRAASDG